MIDTFVGQQDFYLGIQNIQNYVIGLEQIIAEQASQYNNLKAMYDQLVKENDDLKEQLNRRPFWEVLFK